MKKILSDFISFNGLIKTFALIAFFLFAVGVNKIAGSIDSLSRSVKGIDSMYVSLQVSFDEKLEKEFRNTLLSQQAWYDTGSKWDGKGKKYNKIINPYDLAKDNISVNSKTVGKCELDDELDIFSPCYKSTRY